MFDRSIDVADRLEIHELYARYCHTADAGDGPGWSACFTRDGRFVPSLTGSAGKLFEGRDALAGFITDPARVTGQKRHWITAISLRRNGEEIEGTCYAQLLDAAAANAPRIEASVVYHDRIVREDGAWLFKERCPVRDGA